MYDLDWPGNSLMFNLEERFPEVIAGCIARAW